MDAPGEALRAAAGDNDSNCAPPSLSINQLAALHPRERLLVRPERWTDRQLSLLPCRFHSHGEGGRAKGMPTEYRSPELSDLESGRLAIRLDEADNLEDRIKLIDDLLRLVSELGDIRPWYLSSAQLYFNQHPCATFGPYGYEDREIITAAPHRKKISFALFDSAEPSRKRFQHLRPKDWLWRSGAEAERMSILGKRLAPSDRYRDPYLAAVIIAMAQKERRKAPQQASPGSGGGFTVRLLFVDRESPSLFQYVAHVQGAFLDMFDHPARQPPPSASGNPGLDIHCWEIPTDPGPTFAHRLAWALRTDCCGEVHDDVVEGEEEENAAGEMSDAQAGGE
ncbi:uncharacterized protein B0T15DRAFT_499579 [Chaetomium strumarium]|uniref:Uncharacterized protein n=1 Tax=Chaetomium strumarium TaxID=1170767 RepID=A0AAJ0H4X2_9PEZI|nr:hypothetical protein B0T15DRAFT_499579 [Chaetomium strumarium]